MRAPEGSTNRQDCRFARRSRPKGEAHGCAECIPRPDIDARDAGRIPRSFRAVSCERTSLWWPRRPLATLGRKLRQGRKAATVSIDAGAEVSRRGHRLFNPGFVAAIHGATARAPDRPAPPSMAAHSRRRAPVARKRRPQPFATPGRNPVTSGRQHRYGSTGAEVSRRGAGRSKPSGAQARPTQPAKHGGATARGAASARRLLRSARASRWARVP